VYRNTYEELDQLIGEVAGRMEQEARDADQRP
jgi:hypothetical protein